MPLPLFSLPAFPFYLPLSSCFLPSCFPVSLTCLSPNAFLSYSLTSPPSFPPPPPCLPYHSSCLSPLLFCYSFSGFSSLPACPFFLPVSSIFPSFLLLLLQACQYPFTACLLLFVPLACLSFLLQAACILSLIQNVCSTDYGIW